MDHAAPATRRGRPGTPVVLVGVLVCALLAASAAAALLLAARASASTTASMAAPWSTASCGRDVEPPQRWRTVLWIWLENRAPTDIYGPGSSFPFARTQLTDTCASLDAMHAVQRASLGNYIAAMTGSAEEIEGGCSPVQCPVDRPSLLGQVAASGREWRSYQEALPSPCAARDVGAYLVRHDPAPYLVRERAQCDAWDIPLGSTSRGALADALATDTLPAFALVTPDRCHGGHDCPGFAADTWLRTWLEAITASTPYRRGDVAVFVTWDEGRRSAEPDLPVNAPCPARELRGDCHIATFVIAPGVPASRHVDAVLDHVTLLQLTEAMLALPPIGPPRPAATDIGRELHLLRPG